MVVGCLVCRRKRPFASALQQHARPARRATGSDVTERRLPVPARRHSADQRRLRRIHRESSRRGGSQFVELPTAAARARTLDVFDFVRPTDARVTLRRNLLHSSLLVFTARCYASAVLAMALCLSVRPSVRPSQVGVLLKRLNVGSHKQHHTIAQGLRFSDAKDLREIRPGSPPTRGPSAIAELLVLYVLLLLFLF